MVEGDRRKQGLAGRALLAVLVAGAAALGGCVVAPVQPAYDGPVVMAAPPPPQGEIVGVAPYPGAVWIGGYWGWGGGRHTWVPGRWERPRSGYGWVAPQWGRDGGGWRQRPGYWQRR